MSGRLMGSVYDHEFTHSEQAVLLAMADHAQDDGSHCFPSIARVAWKTGYHKRNVKRVMKGLRETGVLVEVRRATPNHPTEYRILLDAAPLKPPFDPSSADGRDCGQTDTGGGSSCKPDQNRGGNSSGEGRRNVQSGVTPRPPEPSTETSEEEPTTTCEKSLETDRGADVNGDQSDSPAAALAAAEAGGDGQTSLSIGSDRDIDALVDQLWDHYVAEFDPPHKKLSASRARAMRKGFKEEFTLTQLKHAVTGLKIWRRTKPGNESIGAIFTTYPGSDNLADRISFFIEVAEKAGIAGHITSADPAIVQQRQLDVQRGHRSTSPDQVQAAEEAEEWLRQHGIETVRDDDGYPTFRHDGGGA